MIGFLIIHTTPKHPTLYLYISYSLLYILYFVFYIYILYFVLCILYFKSFISIFHILYLYFIFYILYLIFYILYFTFLVILWLGTFLLALTGALVVMMCQYRSIATFSVSTQPIDAIDVTRVTLSCLNNITNAIDVTMSNTECQMSNFK